MLIDTDSNTDQCLPACCCSRGGQFAEVNVTAIALFDLLTPHFRTSISADSLDSSRLQSTPSLSPSATRLPFASKHDRAFSRFKETPPLLHSCPLLLLCLLGCLQRSLPAPFPPTHPPLATSIPQRLHCHVPHANQPLHHHRTPHRLSYPRSRPRIELLQPHSCRYKGVHRFLRSLWYTHPRYVSAP